MERAGIGPESARLFQLINWPSLVHHSVTLIIGWIHIHDHTLTHYRLETAVDEMTVKPIASPSQCVGPHGGDIPAIYPDLHLLDNRYDLFSISISVTYTSSLNPGSAEEGVVVFYPDNPSGGVQPAEMVKVLISA